MIPSCASILVTHEGPGKPGPSALWTTGNRSLDTLLAQAGPDSSFAQFAESHGLRPEAFRAGTSLSHQSTQTVLGLDTLPCPPCTVRHPRSGPERLPASKQYAFWAETLSAQSKWQAVPGRNTLNVGIRQSSAFRQRIGVVRVFLRVPARNSYVESIPQLTWARRLLAARSGPERLGPKSVALADCSLPVPGRNTSDLILVDMAPPYSPDGAKCAELRIICSGPEQAGQVSMCDHTGALQLFVPPVPGRNTYSKETFAMS